MSLLVREEPRAGNVFDLRVFGGFEVEEIARMLDVSERTVVRDYRFARAWLMERIGHYLE